MHVAIVGAGRMGTRLALRCAAHSCVTTLIARDRERAVHGLDEAAAETGFSGAAILVRDDLDAVRDADLVAEAIPEDLPAKRALFAELEARIGAHVPIASGTSTFVPDVLGAQLAHPGRAIVAHMVHPVTLCPIVELIAPGAADPIALARVEEWLERLAMRPIRLRAPLTGFIINRLQFALLREAAHLVERGVADAADVDAIVEFALAPRWAATGPLASADLGGRRTFTDVARSVVPDLDRRERVPLLDGDTPLRAWRDGEADAARARRGRVYRAIDDVR